MAVGVTVHAAAVAAAAAAQEEQETYCAACNKNFSNAAQCLNHKRSKKHLIAAKALRPTLTLTPTPTPTRTLPLTLPLTRR